MNKSHLGTADNPQDLVTAHDIGQLVDVVNVGKGFLRYVGPIHGKDGLFCGIELLEPNGKHDGSYQGVSYFIATPNHGIFAPIFRVSLDQEERKKKELLPDPIKRLSRSALPSLNLRNSFSSTSQDPPIERERKNDIMTTSYYQHSNQSKPIDIQMNKGAQDPMQMSMFSDMMDGSMFSNGSWSDIADSMITSNCTFTVRKGPLMANDDDMDLMNVPMVQSVFNIDREALRREEQLQSSMVIGESRIGVEHLPIIEDENELETPLVENRSISSEISDEKNANSDLMTPIIEVPPISESIMNGNLESVTPLETNEKSKKSPQSETTKTKETKMEAEQPKIVKKIASPPVPAAPKFPVKPKAPSKHQLMMEQLKASIEAEKNKPKKEVKSRVSLLPPPPPKTQKENRESDMTETSSRKSSLSINSKQPLKNVNKTKTSPAPPVERVKKERKPLYVAPPAKERVEKEKKVVKSVVPSPRNIEEKKNIASSIASSSSVGSTISGKNAYPTSSFAGGKIGTTKPSSNSKVSAPTGNGKKEAAKISEVEKLQRLKHSAIAVEALVIVLRELKSKDDEKLKKIEEQQEQKMKEIVELKRYLNESNKKFESDVEQLKCSNQEVVRNNAINIDNLQKKHQAQLADKSKEYEKTIEDERAGKDAEMFAMSNRHQKVVACLDEKIAEAEKQCEQLKVDKKTLQAALANDCDHRNQMLTKEISSLQTALEMKSAEMKELRQKNQNLSLQVDEIPLKELEISKWKHKANEYKQMLDQKITGEKMLVQQIEELRKKQILDEEEKEAIKRSFDLMQFKYENGDDPNVSSFMSAPNECRFGTPTKVQFRSRSSASGTRPPSMSVSSNDHRLSNSSHSGDHDSMSRSTISMYMSQIRLPENHADDVIYAPDEIISSRSGSIAQRLSISMENDGEPTLKKETNGQSDSGIGLVM